MRLLALGAVTLAAIGAATAFGATADTPYDLKWTESPDPVQESRFAERLDDAEDLTGDGVPDIFASSYKIVVDGKNDAGKAALINGATQEIVYELTAPDPEEGARFGFYISVVGDVTGDGLDDIAVGETNATADGNANQGRFYLYDGPTGNFIRQIDNPHPQANANFGSRLGAAGDVNGDGRADIIAGASNQDVAPGCGNVDPVPEGCLKNVGQAFVFSGADGSLLREYNIPAQDPPQPGSNLGFVVQALGDLNGDGVTDHLVGAGQYKPDENRHGRLYVFSGANGEVLTRIDQPEPDDRAFFGLYDNDKFTPGDLNGDGVPEIYGSGFLLDGPNGEESAGRAYVFDGRESLRQEEGVLLFEMKDPDLAPRRAFGWAVSPTDYNKDGTTDLYISGLAGVMTQTYVFDGRDGSLLKELELPASLAQENQTGNTGSALGWSARAPGDLNGDCEPDFVAAAPFQDVGGVQDQGRVFFFLSNGPSACPPPPPPPVPPTPPVPPAPPVVGTCGNPDAAGYLYPAKMRVSRAQVLRSDRRLDVFAPITSRARGAKAKVTFQADNRSDTFEATVTPGGGALDQMRFKEPITRGQAELGTGIVNLEYQGDADTRPEFVRLRAASQRAELDVEEISLIDDQLSAQGSVTGRAQGVIRLLYSYVDPDGTPNVYEARAEIQDNGDWELENDQVPAQLAQCGGYLSIQFTGYFERRIRGEQLAYELNAGQTRRP
jgi:hypothetical protein